MSGKANVRFPDSPDFENLPAFWTERDVPNYPPIRIWKHNDGSAEKEETGESANGDCQETFQVISLRNMHICEFHIASQFAIFIFLYHFLQMLV